MSLGSGSQSGSLCVSCGRRHQGCWEIAQSHNLQAHSWGLLPTYLVPTQVVIQSRVVDASRGSDWPLYPVHVLGEFVQYLHDKGAHPIATWT